MRGAFRWKSKQNLCLVTKEYKLLVFVLFELHLVDTRFRQDECAAQSSS